MRARYRAAATCSGHYAAGAFRPMKRDWIDAH
jgi:hypothetical protein